MVSNLFTLFIGFGILACLTTTFGTSVYRSLLIDRGNLSRICPKCGHKDFVTNRRCPSCKNSIPDDQPCCTTKKEWEKIIELNRIDLAAYSITCIGLIVVIVHSWR